jgi:hypothetical protein
MIHARVLILLGAGTVDRSQRLISLALLLVGADSLQSTTSPCERSTP